MVLARVLAFLLKKVMQPSVIAEVIAGIILGPSVLGFIPNYLPTLFPASSMGPLTVTANIGLVSLNPPNFRRRNREKPSYIPIFFWLLLHFQRPQPAHKIPGMDPLTVFFSFAPAPDLVYVLSRNRIGF